MTKETFPIVCPNPESKDEISQKLNRFSDEMAKRSDYFNAKLTAFYFYCLFILPLGSFAQNPLTLETTISDFKKHYTSKRAIEPQVIPLNSYFVRFNELGAIYNPDFPNTRNMVEVKNYYKKGKKYLYIGRSLSTHRATVILKGRVGEFYCLMNRGDCNAMIAYHIKKEGANLLVTGTLYQCCPP